MGVICSISIGTRNRHSVFRSTTLATATVQVLLDLTASTGVTLYAYCIMPDHVHLVVGPSHTCDIVSFVARFKNLVQRSAWQLGVHGILWQRSFWDHFLRAEEQVERVVEYVLNNPVRGELVERWRDYPFCGSCILDEEALLGGGQAPALQSRGQQGAAKGRG